MPLKAKKEIRHVFYSGSIEELDKYVSDVITDGWGILEVRVVHMDFHSQIFTILYILIKPNE